MPNGYGEKLPWSPLREIASREARLRTQEAPNQRCDLVPSHAEIGAVLGVSSRTVLRRDKTGELFWLYGDSEACFMGLHPCLIWGEEWWKLMDQMNDDYVIKQNNRREQQRAYKRRGTHLRLEHQPDVDAAAAIQDQQVS